MHELTVRPSFLEKGWRNKAACLKLGFIHTLKISLHSCCHFLILFSSYHVQVHHKLRYTDEALMAAAKYSSQYISDRWVLYTS